MPRFPIRVGGISDTHGLLRPQALAALAGSDFIVHGGDIGGAEILGQLAAIAPVTAVRGNNDRDAWASEIPETAVLQVGELRIHVLHDVKGLAVDLGAAGTRVVISGHSHQARVQERDGVLYLNPGSAGPRRFRLPVTVAQLRVERSAVAAEIIALSLRAVGEVRSLLTIDPGTGLDLPEVPNVRNYLIARSQHGNASSTTVAPTTCNQFGSQVDPLPVMRALFSGLATVRNLWDFGPGFDQGILDNVPGVATGKLYHPRSQGQRQQK